MNDKPVVGSSFWRGFAWAAIIELDAVVFLFAIVLGRCGGPLPAVAW